MNASSTATGSTTIATTAERTCTRKRRHTSATMIPSSISVVRSVATEPSISSERSYAGRSRTPRVDHVERVRAHAHHDDPADRLAPAVPVGRAAADLRAEGDAGDVAHA